MKRCFALDCLSMKICKCFRLDSKKERCQWLGEDEMCSYRTEECENYIPEKDNPYPLCDNKECKESKICNISAHMKEEW